MTETETVATLSFERDFRSSITLFWWTSRGNLDHFCLRVDPFDEELIKERAIQAGGTPDDVSERYGADGFGPSMYIKDPEGNVIELKGRPVRQLSREC